MSAELQPRPDSLILWLQTFHVTAPSTTVEDLTDGLAMAQTLHSIDGAWFDGSWLSRIKDEVGDNWRMKASNLRKILQRIKDYYQESLHLQIPESLLPDLSRIAGRSDAGELGRLLQLIVGCAVNCGNKQEHIHAIMRLEESVQHAVMTGIQEVMGKRTVDSVGELEKKLKRATNDIQAVLAENDQLKQRCEELESQVTSLQHDKDRLLAENQTLKEELSQTDTAKRPEAVEPQAYFQIQLQIGQLQEEKIRIEMTKDYYQAYCEELEKELIESRLWNVELENITKETAALKDEVDILRATTDKVTRLESEVEMCFRKLADLKDWLRQVKSMEELNLKYVHDVLYS